MTANLLLENKIICEKEHFLSIQNQFKKRISRFRFLQTVKYLPIFNMMLPIFERTTQSEIK